MKKIILLFTVTGLMTVSLFSQVVINQSDMPAPGDTLRVSITSLVPAGFAQTAMDTTWNFIDLDALDQRVDTFVMATATPSLYQLIFVLLGGANLAAPLRDIPIPGLPITQGFTFYKNSSSAFSNLGTAYTIQGFPLPAKYDNPDKIYKFPMPPGETWSSTSAFSIAVPDMLYYSTQRIRSNEVDGWGNLITPFGTFATVRVKSTLNIHDSIYVDSLAIGFGFDRNIIEYKWIGKGFGIPLLQINEEGPLVTATYLDSCRMPAQPLSVTLGPDTTVTVGATLTLHAKVSYGTPPYQIIWSTLEMGDSITVTVEDSQTYSAVVLDAMQNIAIAQKVVSVYGVGIGERKEGEMNIYPNPTGGTVIIRLPEKFAEADMQVLTMQGKIVRESVVSPSSGAFDADLTGLPEGAYLIKISAKNKIYFGKIQIFK